MAQPNIVSIKAITPKQEMANLKQIAKTHGRASVEYKNALDAMTKNMLSKLPK